MTPERHGRKTHRLREQRKDCLFANPRTNGAVRVRLDGLDGSPEEDDYNLKTRLWEQREVHWTQ